VVASRASMARAGKLGPLLAKALGHTANGLGRLASRS
jgi:hypothetical protein